MRCEAQDVGSPTRAFFSSFFYRTKHYIVVDREFFFHSQQHKIVRSLCRDDLEIEESLDACSKSFMYEQDCHDPPKIEGEM
jgi:hypothetical protein